MAEAGRGQRPAKLEMTQHPSTLSPMSSIPAQGQRNGPTSTGEGDRRSGARRRPRPTPASRWRERPWPCDCGQISRTTSNSLRALIAVETGEHPRSEPANEATRAPRLMATAKAASTWVSPGVDEHQNDKHLRQTRIAATEEDQKQALAARQRVRGDITPHPPANDGCLPEPVKSAYGVPSGSATPPLDRTRPTQVVRALQPAHNGPTARRLS